MPRAACPKCNAEVSSDLFEPGGDGRRCSFCGADLPLPETPERARSTSELAADAHAFEAEDRQHIRPLPPVPEKSKLQIIESTPERLILFIPADGARTAGNGMLAFLGIATLSVPTTLLAMANAAGERGLLLPTLILGLFWVLGVFLVYRWVKMKFERMLLLLDPERIVVQKSLFGRKSKRETLLKSDSRAELVLAYEANEKGVYRVEIQGENGPAKFGTPLNEAEKDWLVDRINEFLAPFCDARNASVNDAPATISGRAGGTSSDVEMYEPLTPQQLPPGCGIEVLETFPECLRFQFGMGPPSIATRTLPLFTLAFAIMWYGFFTFALVGAIGNAPVGLGKFILVLTKVGHFAVGLIPLGIGLYGFWGKSTVELTRERLSCRWSLGRLGYTARMPVPSIDAVRIERSNRQNPRVRGPRAGESALIACVARGGGKWICLAFCQDEFFARLVASLVRTRLEELGHPVP